VLAAWSRGEIITPSAVVVAASTSPETFEQLMYRALTASKAKIDEQAKQLAEAAPKVAFADAVASSPDLDGLRNAAKILGQPPQKWIDWLKSEGYLFYEGTNPDGKRTLVPKAEYSKYFVVKVTRKTVNGVEKTYRQTFVTKLGLQYFAARLPFPRPDDNSRKDSQLNLFRDERHILPYEKDLPKTTH
jgi:phage antirepressor YoqD-like protein